MRALVTGGAGFIGSHLVDRLIGDGHEVRVLDDLSAGNKENLDPTAELFVANVTDERVVRQAIEGVDTVFHLAAHRSVARSVEHPLETDMANVHGTLTILTAAADAHVRRVVYASSSSVYGGAAELPTPESAPLLPRSPYAVTKMTGEHYCRVFSELYQLETVSLRFFNVFGPRQRPDSIYAAVIPLFIDALIRREQPVVFGDGKQSRDFTYVADTVSAVVAAAQSAADVCNGKAYNVAGGRRYSLLDVLESLGRLLDVVPQPRFDVPRAGDVRHSEADITAARQDLGYEPKTTLHDGLEQTVLAARE